MANNNPISLAQALGLGEQQLQIGSRVFEARPARISELAKLPQEIDLDSALEVLSKLLAPRALDKKPVTVKWLSDELSPDEVTLTLTFFRQGSLGWQEFTETIRKNIHSTSNALA